MRTVGIIVAVCVAHTLASCSGAKAKELFDVFVTTRATVEKGLPSETDVMSKISSSGETGAALLPRAQVLAEKSSDLRAREESANQRAVVGLADANVDAIRAATAELQAVGAESEVVRSELTALEKELQDALSVPDTTTLKEVATTNGAHLERVFAKSGWKRPQSATHGVMKANGYTYENFELAKAKSVMTVFIVRPCADCAGTTGTSPAQSAAAAKMQNKVFLFDEKANVYVELMPKTDASEADARALLEALVKPE